jgi:hypothetical protein
MKAVQELQLDLKNFRTVSQKSETASIHSIILINPDWFWDLAKSILNDGYHATDNILVLRSADGKTLTVKEGNRRVGILKMALGLIKTKDLPVPADVLQLIQNLTESWKTENSAVPCAIYDASEKAKVDRIVDLTHGKGHRAGRDMWNAVARARHFRDQTGGSEPALDLLEKYLKKGANVTKNQRERWSGAYPLSVLEEALKKVAPRMKLASAREVADKYPNVVGFKEKLDEMLLQIGSEQLKFPDLRKATDDFAVKLGFPQDAAATTGTAASSTSGNTSGSTSAGTTSAGSTPTTTSAAGKGSKQSSGNPAAVPTTDARSVKRSLKSLSPTGAKKAKLVTLIIEAYKLNLHDTPITFCFVLRALFEISARNYCSDHKGKAGAPTMFDVAKNKDKTLAEALKDVAKHIIANDPSAKNELHGALAHLNNSHEILSVKSMNALIHGTTFTIDEQHICLVFHHVFPLLEKMNT